MCLKYEFAISILYDFADNRSGLWTMLCVLGTLWGKKHTHTHIKLRAIW